MKLPPLVTLVEIVHVFFFFNRAEYVAHDNIPNTIVMSPLLKSKFNNIPRFALVMIKTTPIKEHATPNTWKVLVFSIFKIDEMKMIITGIVEIINTPLITCVKFKE